MKTKEIKVECRPCRWTGTYAVNADKMKITAECPFCGTVIEADSAGGCGAADCSAGREADKGQDDAEERSCKCPKCEGKGENWTDRNSPLWGICQICKGTGSVVGSAALIPPVQAEDMLEDLILTYKEARTSHLKLSDTYAATQPERRAYYLGGAATYMVIVKDLERLLSERRKAKADEPLEHDNPVDELIDYARKIFNTELSGRRNA